MIGPARGVTVQEALRRGAAALRFAGVEEPELEAEVLLRHVLGLSRAQIIARFPQDLTPEQQAAYHELLDRRRAHHPTAYLVGRREFYGLEFMVTPAVLIPRPETELLVEAALAIAGRMAAGGEPPVIVDVGTGSGAVAVCLAQRVVPSRVIATDVSAGALAVAGYNARKHRVAGRIEFRCGDLLDPVPEPPDLVVSNPPYVPTDVWVALPPEIREHEPRLALDGGPDGLDVIRRLLAQAAGRLAPGGALALEIGHDQGPTVADLARAAFPGAAVTVRRDLAGHDRVVTVETAGAR